MKAAVILNSGRLIMDGGRYWYGCSAAVVDLDRTEYQELPDSTDPARVYRIPYHPKLWAGQEHETRDAVERATAEAKAWATTQGLTLHKAPASRGVTGDEADIEANYPGGYAAYLRDEPVAGPTPAQEAEAAESGRIAGASPADL